MHHIYAILQPQNDTLILLFATSKL